MRTFFFAHRLSQIVGYGVPVVRFRYTPLDSWLSGLWYSIMFMGIAELPLIPQPLLTPFDRVVHGFVDHSQKGEKVRYANN